MEANQEVVRVVDVVARHIREALGVDQGEVRRIDVRAGNAFAFKTKELFRI